MKKGIIWICWYATSGLEEDHSGRNRVMDRQIKQLEYSVKWARMEGYPVNVFIEKPHEMGWVLGCTRYYDDLYNFLNEDEITFYDYPDKYHLELRSDYDLPGDQKGREHPYWYNRFFRKHYIFPKSPFDMTSYLDTDCYFMNHTNHKVLHAPKGNEYAAEGIGLDWIFDKLENQYTFAASIEGPPFIYNRVTHNIDGEDKPIQDRWDELCEKWVKNYHGHVPLLQGGVTFFNKNSEHFLPTLELSEEIMVQEYHISACVYHAGHTCNDQVTLSLAVEELKVPIMYLNPMTWCRRGITGGGGNYPMLTESGVKIMHSAEWFDAWLRRYG